MYRYLFTIILFFQLALTVQAQLATQATDVSPLMNGEQIPNATLSNVDGEAVDLKELMSDQPTLFIFYRGSWCPFCNRQLSALQEALPTLTEMGIQVVAISPDKAENMQETVSTNNLSYTVLSDEGLVFTQKMGLAFVDQKERKLPVPAVYLVDTAGLIQFNYVNPNYKVRPDPALIIAAAKVLMK